jgi:hypothetical protein
MNNLMKNIHNTLLLFADYRVLCVQKRSQCLQKKYKVHKEKIFAKPW